MDESRIKYRSRWLYIAIAIFLGTIGVQKLYARNFGAFVLWVAFVIFLSLSGLEPLVGLMVFIDIVITLFTSDEKFFVKCNKRAFRGIPKEERYEIAKNYVKTGANAAREALAIKLQMQDDNQIAIEVPGEEDGESESHNHIKANENLTNEISKAQDRLDRFQGNNYFPSANSSQVYDRRTRSQKLSELREELKSGLISKEEYQEKLREL